MKYIVLIGDGMADRPIGELGGKTPLQAAHTPNMDWLASRGTVGVVHTIPEGFYPGSDVANLSVLGYAPSLYYSGRAPLEAASIGVDLQPNDVAYRCNLVTLKFKRDRSTAIMDDYSAGHIETAEAARLIKTIEDQLGNEEFSFYPGVSYRHLMVWHDGKADIECAAPHDIMGRSVGDYLPVGDGADRLLDLMRRSVDILERHEVNIERVAKGKKPANSIWLWGQGRRPKMPPFKDKYGLSGALISAVDLTKGLGIYAGFKIVNVPGATGWIDTNYSGKAEYGLKALEEVDFLYLHVEAPDEAGHAGRIDYKIKAIEDIDGKIVGPILEGLKNRAWDFKILLMPDHPTPIELRTHSSDPVPFVIYDSRVKGEGTNRGYSEEILRALEAVVIKDGFKLMDLFINERP